VRSSAQALEQAPARSITTIKSGNTDVDIEDREEIETELSSKAESLGRFKPEQLPFAGSCSCF
jgi:hypothetical protein